jgi:hypothetical protein
MAIDSEYEADLSEPAARRKSGWSTCLVGCLIALVGFIVLAAAVGYWISQNWRDWASSAATQAIKLGIDEADLPPQEKEEIIAHVDRLADDFREGRLSNEQLGMIFEKLMESPLMTSVIVSAAERQYFDQSGLSEEEKATGRLTLQRFLRGVIDGVIERESVDAALQHIADRQPDGEWRLRDQVSDEQLRAFLEAAEREADEADIAESPEAFDPSDEFQRIVDEAMNAP